jgi:hypothetical protein
MTAEPFSDLIEKCERARVEGTPLVEKCTVQRQTAVVDNWWTGSAG